MKKPLEFCVNGDGRPVQPPSWVLCAECFKLLDTQVRTLLGNVVAPSQTRET